MTGSELVRAVPAQAERGDWLDAAAPAQRLDEATVRSGQLDELVGLNAGYYRTRFLDLLPHAAGFGSGGFNWAAFVLGPAWFAYRKMRGLAIGYLLLQLLVVAIAAYFRPMAAADAARAFGGGQPAVSAGIAMAAVAILLFVGLRANALYFRHLSERLATDASAQARAQYAGTCLLSLAAIGAATLLAAYQVDKTVAIAFRL